MNNNCFYPMIILLSAKVINQKRNAITFCLFVNDRNIQILKIKEVNFKNTTNSRYLFLYLNKNFHFSTFPQAPQISWNVEQDGLKKQCEANPLVVLVKTNLLLILGLV